MTDITKLLSDIKTAGTITIIEAHKIIKALEQLQAEIEENNLIIRELIFCIDKKASKSHMQRTINKAMKISNTRGSIVL